MLRAVRKLDGSIELWDSNVLYCTIPSKFVFNFGRGQYNLEILLSYETRYEEEL